MSHGGLHTLWHLRVLQRFFQPGPITRHRAGLAHVGRREAADVLHRALVAFPLHEEPRRADVCHASRQAVTHG